MGKKTEMPPDIWDNEAEEYYRSRVPSCWNCGGFYIKHAYMAGFERGLKAATEKPTYKPKKEADYPFDELQAWIDGVTTHKNKD